MTMTKWNEVTEERYDEMLGVLPPRLMSGHGFLVGEPFTHRTCTASGHVLPDWAAFVYVGGRYFEGPNMTVPEWRAFDPMELLTLFDPAILAAGMLPRAALVTAAREGQELGEDDGL